MTKKQIYKKFNNLSKKELTLKNNKKTYVRNKEQKLIKNDLLTETIFEEKRQKALEKKLGYKFITINTNNAKNGYCQLAIWKHLLISSKIKNQRTRRKNKKNKKLIM